MGTHNRQAHPRLAPVQTLIRNLAVALLALAPPATTQTTPPQTVQDALHTLADDAAIIFTGQVLSVRQIPNSSIVEVAFHIHRALRGCTPNSTYVLREWAGLWTTNTPRYRPGQQLLMLLHAPGPAGLSSPIANLDGAIPIRGIESAFTSSAAQQTTSQQPVSQGPVSQEVDLRWIATHVAHPTLSPPTPANYVASTTIQAPASLPTSIPTQSASVDTILTLLTAWNTSHAAQ